MYQSTRRLSLLVLSLFLLVLSLTLATPRSAEALPEESCYCLYYSNSSYTTVIGEKFVHCNGQIDREGNTSTPYKICDCEPCF